MYTFLFQQCQWCCQWSAETTPSAPTKENEFHDTHIAPRPHDKQTQPAANTAFLPATHRSFLEWLAPHPSSLKNLTGLKKESVFFASRCSTIRSVHRVGVDGFWKISANGSGQRIFWIRSAHNIAIFRNGIFALQHLNQYRPLRHKLNEIAKKRTFSMNRVKLFCLLTRQLHHFCSNNLQLRLFKARYYLSNDIILNSIRLDDRKCFFNRHNNPRQK